MKFTPTTSTNLTENSFTLRPCTFVRLSLVNPLLILSSRPTVSVCPWSHIVSSSGAVDKGGQGGAGPSPGASDSRGGACSSTGAVPSRSDSIRSMVTGGSKAGRWQTVQSHMHTGALRFSKWVAHGDMGYAWGATVGTTGAWFGYHRHEFAKVVWVEHLHVLSKIKVKLCLHDKSALIDLQIEKKSIE